MIKHDKNAWIDIGADNFIPRGSTIRGKNTNILVMAVYTGKETKICLNNGPTKYKNSSAEFTLNLIFGFAIFQIIIFSVYFTIRGRIHYEEYKDKEWFHYEGI